MSRSSATGPPPSLIPGKAVRTVSSAAKQSSGKPGKAKRPATSSDLKKKEEEYRRLNAQLEARTAKLVKEAEHLVVSSPLSYDARLCSLRLGAYRLI